MLSPARISRFQRAILAHYQSRGRRFPWRSTRRPYHILVSEIMLQQTQTERVIEKYREFLRAFPALSSLAQARTADVLRVWQGLGYNRRALALQRAARLIMERFGGRVPRRIDDLESLPGVGPYTAAAVACFAWNAPGVLIETNIRAVFIAEFFAERSGVRDDEIAPLVEETLYRRDPRRWYYALMDYGVALKREQRGIGKRSAHYVRQSPFRGSRRELRGKILRRLAACARVREECLRAELELSHEESGRIFERLESEGLLRRRGGFVSLPR